MKTPCLRLVPILLSCATFSASAAVHYVDVASPAPASPYNTWATAAITIQDAVDAAAAGDQILVTNGLYNVGAQVVVGAMSNRVAVTKPVTVQSVNGPNVTIIQGYQAPGTTNGDSAVRCVYLTYGASLVGFTLTNGATRATGSTRDEQSGGGLACAATSAWVSNCVITGNAASQFGAGAANGRLMNCTLSGNIGYHGGGAYSAVLYNCTLTGNSAVWGGGADSCTLGGSVLTGNSAQQGGGASGGTLNNCTLTGNSAVYWGGGADSATLNNCIVYFNNAYYSPNDRNYHNANLAYSCTAPLPASGSGNLSADPQLASLSHLSADSPGRGAGSIGYPTGVDIDGEPWASSPSIGCDEFYPGKATGTLYPSIRATDTYVTVGVASDFVANITGKASASAWDFGDGTVVSNRPYASHVWTNPGDYTVSLRAYNDSWPGGVTTLFVVHAGGLRVHYVSLSSASPQPPFATWATAATTIQDAVDAAAAGDQILVSNGVYNVGARVVVGAMSNRVAVTNPMTVQSVNGPNATIIQGYQVPGTTNGDSAVRCVYLANGAALIGFTLTNGATRATGGPRDEQSGGGVACAGFSSVVSNCVITGNAACAFGGGTIYGTLANCILSGNSEIWNSGTFGGGGGAAYSTLLSCTLSGNRGCQGGGAFSATLTNCTLTGTRQLAAEGQTPALSAAQR